MFKSPFSFEGRIRRLEYGLSYVICIVFQIAMELTSRIENLFVSFAILLSCVPVLWFILAQGAKRCHDRGHSGIWQLNPFYIFWMLFGDGEKRDNEYGSNPKGLEYQILIKNWHSNNTTSHIDNVDGVIKSEI